MVLSHGQFSALLLLLSGLQRVRLVKCYVCSSPNPACRDPLDLNRCHMSECSNSTTMCFKMFWKVPGERRREYARGCSIYGTLRTPRKHVCQTHFGEDGTTASYCYCDDMNGCNSAIRSDSSHHRILTVVFYVLMMVLLK